MYTHDYVILYTLVFNPYIHIMIFLKVFYDFIGEYYESN